MISYMRYQLNFQKFCFLGVAVIFFAVLILIRLRLLGLPLERDEGEYAYMAQQLLQGVLPYTESQSMKFPGIYFVYAGVLSIIGESASAIHFALLLVNLATAFILYLLSRTLLGQSAGIATAVSFAVLSLSPTVQGPWANSEHFVLLPAIGGILLLRMAQCHPNRFFLSGLLLGTALLIKQHAIFYCLFGIFFLGIQLFRLSQPLKKPFLYMGLFVLGGLTPAFLAASLYFTSGNFSYFWFCTVQYASEYVSMTSAAEGLENFNYNFANILESNFPILWLSLIGLVSVTWRERENYFFLLGFFLFSFLAVTPGLYFRPHYFLLWVPALALFAGLGFKSLAGWISFPKIKYAISSGILILFIGLTIFIQKDYFFTLPTFKLTRLVYGLNPFSESLTIAKHIQDNSEKKDTIAILGSEPQIYFFSKRKSASRHLYMYPLMEKHVYALQMQAEMVKEIEEARPKFIVVANLHGSWWSSRPDLTPTLNDWAQEYLISKYEISGVVDILAGDSIYKMGRQAKGYTPKSRYHILIHKRRA